MAWLSCNSVAQKSDVDVTELQSSCWSASFQQALGKPLLTCPFQLREAARVSGTWPLSLQTQQCCSCLGFSSVVRSSPGWLLPSSPVSKGPCDDVRPTRIIQDNFCVCWLDGILIPSATSILFCQVTSQSHRFWRLVYGYLWGDIILPIIVLIAKFSETVSVGVY